VPLTLQECFSALGLKANASEREVRQAYLDLVKLWHPDRFESDAGREMAFLRSSNKEAAVAQLFIESEANNQN